MHGMSADATRVERCDKHYRYLIGARSREDLDARLLIFRNDVLPELFPDDVDLQNEHCNRLQSTNTV